MSASATQGGHNYVRRFCGDVFLLTFVCLLAGYIENLKVDLHEMTTEELTKFRK